MTLHLTRKEKFTKPFIDFIKENIGIENHFFLLVGGNANTDFILEDNDYTKTLHNKNDFFKYFIDFTSKMYKSDKIIIHGLSQPYSILFLFFNPWLLKKCHWIIWGADLYGYLNPKTTFKHKLLEYMKSNVIKKMGHFITYVKGDYELAKKWYGADGEYHECFMYPSNLYTEYNIQIKEHSTINIQVGNSASLTNNHLEVFEKLKKYRDEDINIYIPLSYGDKEYANDIISKGKDIFGDKFKPMTEFMPFEKYLEFLGDIDIAIFAHKRQQAMGNTITLLGLGKKVYMRSDITPWELFKDIDVKVFDVENIDLELFTKEEKQSNQSKIKEYFSEENYLEQLKYLFNDKN